jgi:uncharacterized membrane protein
LIGLLIWASGGSAWAHPAYELQALEPPPGHDRSCASGINDLGLIAGHADNEPAYPPRPVAVLWQGGQAVQIDTRGGTGEATAANRHGRVAGTMAPGPEGQARAFSFRQRSGVFHVLPGTNARAAAINDRGTIVGSIGEHPVRPFVYENGVMSLLDVPADHASAVGVNNAGVVLVMASWDGGSGGYVYENGVLTEIRPSAYVSGLNESGVVTGWRSGADGRNAILYAHGSLQVLPNPEGMSDCYGSALNDANVVVGTCDGDRSRINAIWRDGKVFDLFKLVTDGSADDWSPASVEGVNRSGQIVGCAWRREGSDWVLRGFLLNPVH